MSEEDIISFTENYKKKITEMNKIFGELESLCGYAAKMQSNFDAEVANVYHLIEGVEIKHVSESHKLFMHLKDVLNRRRMVKETAILSALLKPVIAESKSKTASIIDGCRNKNKAVLNELKEVTNAKEVMKILKIDEK
jgi:hypothetical protein